MKQIIYSILIITVISLTGCLSERFIARMPFCFGLDTVQRHSIHQDRHGNFGIVIRSDEEVKDLLMDYVWQKIGHKYRHRAKEEMKGEIQKEFLNLIKNRKWFGNAYKELSSVDFDKHMAIVAATYVNNSGGRMRINSISKGRERIVVYVKIWYVGGPHLCACADLVDTVVIEKSDLPVIFRFRGGS